MLWNYWIQTRQTGGQTYSDTFPFNECSLDAAHSKDAIVMQMEVAKHDS